MENNNEQNMEVAGPYKNVEGLGFSRGWLLVGKYSEGDSCSWACNLL